jgi:hypothetical protein
MYFDVVLIGKLIAPAVKKSSHFDADRSWMKQDSNAGAGHTSKV